MILKRWRLIKDKEPKKKKKDKEPALRKHIIINIKLGMDVNIYLQ